MFKNYLNDGIWCLPSVLFSVRDGQILRALFSIPHPNSNPIHTNTNLLTLIPTTLTITIHLEWPRTENSLEQIQVSFPGTENIIYVVYDYRAVRRTAPVTDLFVNVCPINRLP